MIRLPLRAVAFGTAVTTLVLGLVALPALSLVDVQPAAADNPSCIDAYFNVGNLINPPHQQVDPEVGTYVAGNFTTGIGASEMEGTFVIGGSANFNSGAYFNVGTVGAGSQYVPASGSDMLTVGGNMTIGTAPNFVEVGNLTSPTGGDVVVGGSISVADQAKLDKNGGTLTQGGGASVITPYAPIATLYSTRSTQFSALANTGTVTTDSGNVNFTSTNSDTRQVFTVAGNVLGTVASTKSFNFINIPTDAVIIVNVTGTTAVLSSNVFTLNGVSINPTAAEPNRVFSHFTQSLLWNFGSATSVTLGRQDQLLGSILVPTAGSSTQLLTSTNGRLYINGNLTLGGGTTESGLEIHNYPFRNACTVSTGSLSITKALSDPTDVVSDTRAFTGTYSCVDSVPTVVASGTWSVLAGATQTVAGIPVGAVCSITEDALTAPPTSSDGSYVWSAPSYSPATQTIGAGTTVNITATNSFTRQTGSLSIAKSLTDPDGVVSATRHFTGTYSCVNAASAVVASGSWDVVVGTPQVVTGIPAAATCTIVESALAVAPSATDTSYVWGTPTYSPTSVTTSNATTVSIAAVNTVLRNVGSLAITKSLSDPSDVVSDARLFTGTYSCVPLSGATITGTWSVAAGATQTVTGLPQGAVCSITENALTVAPNAADSSFVWGAPTYSPANGTVTTGGTVTLTAVNSFTRQVGILAITKSLTDPDNVVASGRSFTGTYSCTPQTGSAITGTWSVAAGATQTVTGIPAGSTCSIVEDALTVAPSSTDSTYLWSPPTYSPASVVTANGTTVTLTAQNTVLHSAGSISIAKTLSDPGNIVDDARSFTGTYSCTTAGAPITGTWSVTAGGTPQVVAGLPTGSVCTILEDALTVAPNATDSSYVWGTPTYSPASQTVATGSTVALTAVNSFTRQTGSLAITKSLTDPNSVVSVGRLFTGTYSCAPLSGSAITGSWSVAAGATQTVTAIPAGSTCTIVEDALAVAPSSTDSSYVWGAPSYSPASVVTANGTTVTLTAVNTVTRTTGSIAITKTLSDPNDVVSDTRAFSGSYTCTPLSGTAVTGSWSVVVGATQTVTGIPSGSTCSITENALTAAPSSTDVSYVWGAPTYSPTSGTVTTGGTVTLTAQNSFTRATGSFAITKALTDPDGVVTVGRTFTGTYSCAPQTGSAITGSWSVAVGATQTVTSIPTGSTCSIVEDALTVAPSSTDASYVWGAPTYSPSTVTTTGGTVTITAQNTVTQGLGSFTIVKALTDPNSVVTVGRSFTGSYSCATGSTPVTGTWSVTTTASQTVSGIPAGAICSITEDALTVAPSSTDVSYVWGAPSYSNAVTITDGGSATITATNTVQRQLGTFAITKALSDTDGVVSSGRAFTGTYNCTPQSGSAVTGTWSVTAGATQNVTGVPAGATCSVTEDALTVSPSSTDSSYVWGAPSYSPTSTTVANASTVTITATNTVQRQVGRLSITKTLTDTDSVVTAGRVFTGTYSCTASSVVVASGTWSLTAGGAAFVTPSLPANSSCTVAEDALTAASTTDSSYVWRTPTVSPATTVVANSGTPSGVVVHNEVRRALGDLEMIKVLDDSFHVVNLSRVYTGTFDCVFNNVDVTPGAGTWSSTAGAAPVALATDLPMGTVCTIAEDALTDPPLAGFPQYQWAAPTFAPATVTVGDGTLHRFTVTNHVYDPFEVLAHTGSDIEGSLLAGGGAFLAGLILMLAAYRRRVALRTAKPVS